MVFFFLKGQDNKGIGMSLAVDHTYRLNTSRNMGGNRYTNARADRRARRMVRAIRNP